MFSFSAQDVGRSCFPSPAKLTAVGATVAVAALSLLWPAPPAQAATGNIGSSIIEIDTSANLYQSGTPNFTNGPILNSGANADWVADTLPNSDSRSLIDSIATGITPGVTGAAGGTGHWRGLRIVDGIAGNDKDIFLTGGKENDVSTWNVGPGTVGSSKYDITQAYLANSNDRLFFGMERRGNDGTTAFDFEFNQKAPLKPTVPVRTVGDVLFTFEMQGSGNTGSATPYYFVWNGSKYVRPATVPASLISSINKTDTKAAPWGYVDSKGAWVLGNLPRFEFAEASVLLREAFPNFNPCNNRAFVQVRTRSSSTETSDLKDTTRIFEYNFGGPTPEAALAGTCDQTFIYDASGSVDTNGGNDLTYRWEFLPPAGVTLNGIGITGPASNGAYLSAQMQGVVNVVLPTGVNSTTIAARLTVTQGGTCSTTLDSIAVNVLRKLTASVAKANANGEAMTVTLSGSAPGATGFQWQQLNGSTWINISGATAATFVYSNFEVDATPTSTTFSMGGSNYYGQLFSVPIRLVATRTVNGQKCYAVSPSVTLKKVIAVDP